MSAAINRHTKTEPAVIPGRTQIMHCIVVGPLELGTCLMYFAYDFERERIARGLYGGCYVKELLVAGYSESMCSEPAWLAATSNSYAHLDH